MIGSYSVGKTSMVRQFVDSIFSDKYLTTVGVKIDKKTVEVDGCSALLMLWDLAGEDEFCKLNPAYLRGAAGYLLVVDGTRPNTFEKALELQEKVRDLLSDAPFILIINKSDIKHDWLIDMDKVSALAEQGWCIIETSAKTGQNVEQAFSELTRKMLN